MFNININFKIAFLLQLILIGMQVPAQQTNQRPNIVIILADDMGFSDIGSFGGEIPTPNLDKLAANGLRLNQFYNTARCCPTRASLLTGLYPHQAGVGFMTEALHNNPSYQGYLNKTCLTLGEAMKENGYFTIMTGKWHLGHKEGMRPADRGFDRSLNAPAGGFYFSQDKKAKLFLNGKPVSENSGLPTVWYSTDLWTEYSLKFIDEAKKEVNHFYCTWHKMHHIFHYRRRKKRLKKFRGNYLRDWEQLRKERYQRQIKMGIIDENCPLTPKSPIIPEWNSLTPQKQNEYDDMMAIYAAVVSRLDKAVGDLIDGLKKKNEVDNTIIIFISDNGGNAEPGVNGRYEGEQPGGINSIVHIGQPWAAVNNTPFWLYKHHTSEGGIASPCIISWPAGLPASQKGKINSTPVHLIDIMPTCLDIANGKYPTVFNDSNITPVEGVSILPVIKGKPIKRNNPIFWEHEGNRAMRSGKWKIVSNVNEPWQLYDMESDRTELNDLSGRYSEKLKELLAMYEAWYKKVGAQPYFNKPKKWQYSIQDVMR